MAMLDWCETVPDSLYKLWNKQIKQMLYPIQLCLLTLKFKKSYNNKVYDVTSENDFRTICMKTIKKVRLLKVWDK